jgi:tRNA threonylcarbamoyladenosine modification (KEOPS) complex  Pcc1 subunit
MIMARKTGKTAGFYVTIRMPKSSGVRYMEIIDAQKQPKHSRSTQSVKESKDCISIEIRAHDLASLRAAFNSITRDGQVVENTLTALNQ